jgi:hypothetical protein
MMTIVNLMIMMRKRIIYKRVKEKQAKQINLKINFYNQIY